MLFQGTEKGRKILSWSNGSTKKRLEARLKEQAEEYRAAGMTEEAIAEIAAFDLQVMRSDRKYDRHNQSLHPGAGEPGDAPEPGYDGSEMPLEDRLGWLEEIETPALAETMGVSRQALAIRMERLGLTEGGWTLRPTPVLYREEE